MPCYCDEIEIYNREINQLINTKAKIPAVESVNKEIEQQLRMISSLCEDAFMASCMAEIKKALGDIPKPFIQIIGREEASMSSIIREMGHNRAQCMHKDHEYHEEIRRRHRH